MRKEGYPELFDGDIVELRNGKRGVVAGDIIAFPCVGFSLDYTLMDNYDDHDITSLYEAGYDIMMVFRVDWGDDTQEGSREYKLVWARETPRDLLEDGDTVTLRNGMTYTVTGVCLIDNVTKKLAWLWSDFTNDLLYRGYNKNYAATPKSDAADVMVITRGNAEIWRRET